MCSQRFDSVLRTKCKESMLKFKFGTIISELHFSLVGGGDHDGDEDGDGGGDDGTKDGDGAKDGDVATDLVGGGDGGSVHP